MDECDRCGVTDDDVRIFDECRECGPINLCDRCRCLHRVEMDEETDR